jgi:uncharacterized membrane protein
VGLAGARRSTYTVRDVTRAHALLALRGALCIGLAASAALAVDYRSAGSAFCGPESGCAALRQTDLAYLWGIGITLPELGLFGLAVAFALTLLRDATWGARLALLAGAAGLVLLALQALLLETYCWLCVTTDVSSVIAGAFGVVALKKPRAADDRAPMRLAAWIALPVVVVVATALWPRLKPAPAVPAEIQSFYLPGKINVIDMPLAEGKEVVGGYAIFEFKTREEAIQSAVEFMEVHRKFHEGWEGTCEMRPMMGDPHNPPS